MENAAPLRLERQLEGSHTGRASPRQGESAFVAESAWTRRRLHYRSSAAGVSLGCVA